MFYFEGNLLFVMVQYDLYEEAVKHIDSLLEMSEMTKDNFVIIDTKEHSVFENAKKRFILCLKMSF